MWYPYYNTLDWSAVHIMATRGDYIIINGLFSLVSLLFQVSAKL